MKRIYHECDLKGGTYYLLKYKLMDPIVIKILTVSEDYVVMEDEDYELRLYNLIQNNLAEVFELEDWEAVCEVV
jgi:hypothetical protein